MERNIVKLGELASLITKGTTPSNIGADFTDSGIMYFRSELVGRTKYIDKSSGLLYISNETHNKLKRSQLKVNDILFSMAGAYLGKISIVGKDDYPANTNQAVALIRLKSETCNVDYIYYYIKQKWFNEYVCSLTAQAAQPNINLEQISNLKINLPSLTIQQKIASILSAYDSLIENNQKRIKLLEQMAENLYKEWFVRFRFPGYETVAMKTSKLGKIPTSFDIKVMGEIFDYYIGGGWGNDEQSNDFPTEASVIRGADFPNVWHYDISTCPRRYHKISNYQSRQLEAGDIVFEISGGTSEQPVGRSVLITKELINRFQDSRVICASFCKLIRVKKDIISPIYFYFWLKYLYETRIIDRFQLQSTGIINFKFESFLKKGTVILPLMSIMKQFENYVENLYCEMNNLAKQNDLLTTQRDLLLPRLMSGKLSI